MALKAGIVGLPNVGKSTLFNCLSSAKAQAANFPFCTIDAQLGQISVPDERLTKLAELINPDRIVPATCEIVDIAGLVKGASKGEGLGNQFLGNIRETDAIIHVLRCFDNDNIVHVDGSVDPVRDKEIIDTELQLKDLETVENRIKRVEKIAKVGGDKAAKIEYELLLRYKDALEQGQSARTVIPQNDDEEQCAKQMFLLTTKPVLYVCNVDDVSAASGNQYVEQVREAIKGEDAELIIISAQTEADIACAAGRRCAVFLNGSHPANVELALERCFAVGPAELFAHYSLVFETADILSELRAIETFRESPTGETARRTFALRTDVAKTDDAVPHPNPIVPTPADFPWIR